MVPQNESDSVCPMGDKDWEEAWSTDQIGFHQDKTSTYLERFADEVWGTSMGRVFVPLCGKSLDLVFLADRASDVVGVEFVEQAVQDFFSERARTPSISNDGPTRYIADPYTVFAADFFAVTQHELGEIDAVFDRASMVALDPETRARYAAHMAAILPTGAKTLLLTFTYDQAAVDGPPFSVPSEEIHRLYSDAFEIEHLDTRDVLNEVFRERGLDAMTESAHVLTRR